MQINEAGANIIRLPAINRPKRAEMDGMKRSSKVCMNGDERGTVRL